MLQHEENVSPTKQKDKKTLEDISHANLKE